MKSNWFWPIFLNFFKGFSFEPQKFLSFLLPKWGSLSYKMVSYKKKWVYLFVQAQMCRFHTPLRQTCWSILIVEWQLSIRLPLPISCSCCVNMDRTAAIFLRNVETRVLDFCRRWPQVPRCLQVLRCVGQQSSAVTPSAPYITLLSSSSV